MPNPSLLSFDDALRQLLALATPLASERLPLADSLGRYLAANCTARLTLPAAAVSAMDGYALQFDGLPGPFRIVTESAAGHPAPTALRAGEAARIFTGAVLPAGADTVGIQENAVVNAAVGGAELRFPGDRPGEAGAHIRARGADFSAGDVVGRAGQCVTPARLGFFAAAGIGEVQAHRRPRVAILSTGDELVPAGATLCPGQIIDSNAPMIAALLRGAGADAIAIGPVADRADALAAAIGEAQGHDLVVTIGGASVGDHDLVRPALLAAGAELSFWKVAIRPGKPLLAGRLGSVPVVGLPGNPASAFVCARLFLLPLVRRLAGAGAPADAPLSAAAAVPLAENGPRRHFLRARVADGRITPAEHQDSSLYSVLSESNALLIRPERAAAVAAGTIVPYLPLTASAE